MIWMILGVIAALISLPTSARADEPYIQVLNSPRPFLTVPPKDWVRQKTLTGNSRIKFVSPKNTPVAECAVIAKEFPALRNTPQAVFDQEMVLAPNRNDLRAQLSTRYNNVKIFSTSVTSISGFPAQFSSLQYSVGTPNGEVWTRGLSMTFGTTPGLIWTVGCGALGNSSAEAIEGFSYWQAEMLRFPTNLKLY